METAERTYTTIDKTAWGPGPWQDEPDKVQWTDAETGLPCLAKRHAVNGHLCGYVGVSEGHPAFEIDGYDDEVNVEVHGGLTYAAHCEEGDEAHAICHIPEPGQPDHVWWFGFDCGHFMDFQPGMKSQLAALSPTINYPFDPDTTYRTLDYVRAETARLASQLAALA